MVCVTNSSDVSRFTLDAAKRVGVWMVFGSELFADCCLVLDDGLVFEKNWSEGDLKKESRQGYSFLSSENEADLCMAFGVKVFSLFFFSFGFLFGAFWFLVGFYSVHLVLFLVLAGWFFAVSCSTSPVARDR